MDENKNNSEQNKNGATDVDNAATASDEKDGGASETIKTAGTATKTTGITETATTTETEKMAKIGKIEKNKVEKSESGNIRKVSPAIRIAFTLGAIAVVTAFMLAALNSITEPVIQARRDEEKRLAIAELFGGDMSDIITTTLEAELTSPVTEVLILNKTTGEFAGYCISTQPNGFGGKINILVAVGTDNKILGVNILEMNETVGIGTQVGNDSFLSQFKGKGGGDISADSVDVIGGATISSKAVLNGVAAAVNQIKDLSPNSDSVQPSGTAEENETAGTTGTVETTETTEITETTETAGETIEPAAGEATEDATETEGG